MAPQGAVFPSQLTLSPAVGRLPRLEGQAFSIAPEDRAGKAEGGKREAGDGYKEGLPKRGPEAKLPAPKLKQDFSVTSYGKVLLRWEVNRTGWPLIAQTHLF